MFCPKYRRNFGRGRYIPFYTNNKVKVHISVERQIELSKGIPQAHNWTALQELHMVQYFV